MTPRELSFGWSMPVIGLVNPRRLNAGLVPTPSRLGEPVRVENLDVGRRTAIEQRFDQEFSNAARAGDAVGIAPPGHDKTLHVTAHAVDEPALRRKGRPAFVGEPYLM